MSYFLSIVGIGLAIVFSSTLNAQRQDSKVKKDSQVADGIYLVERWTNSPQDLEPLFRGEVALQHDPRWIDPESKDEKITVTIRRDIGVPLANLEELSPVKESDGRVRLNLTLPAEYAKSLESMSRKYLGRQVVVVIGNRAWTMHKVRSIIRGGKMQIMRCTDEGCQVILRLIKRDQAPVR